MKGTISLRGAPHDGQEAASAGSSVPHLWQFIPITDLPRKLILLQCFGRSRSTLSCYLHFCSAVDDSRGVRLHNPGVNRADVHPVGPRGGWEAAGRGGRVLVHWARLVGDACSGSAARGGGQIASFWGL